MSVARVQEVPPLPTPSEGAMDADPLRLPVLVLNRVYQPVRITNVRRAMGLLFTDTARALDADGELFAFEHWLMLPVRENRDDGLTIVGGCLRVPRIVHLRRYARVRRSTVRLTRRNLMLRDAFTCQYCGHRRSVRDLDIDHVQPRSRKGEDSWTNLVTACQPCNRRKGRRTPNEANMPLMSRPRPPRWSTAVQLLAGTRRRYKEWEPFLQAG